MSESFSHPEWEPVIGLEIHAELNTRSKLFSKAPNRFGDEPNTNISEVCTGQPGSLHVLNKEAVKKAVQFGLSIQGKVAKFSKFDRKSYFYPDSPRNFQITQYDEPIVIGGTIIAEVDGKEIGFSVERVQLEDDTGMLKHFSRFAGIDYNRAGVPLIEIVSTPCIKSPKEAVSYAMAVRAILQYLDVSDCNMEEGSIRFDANVSVRKKGETSLRTKTEIKNMNSFSNMEIALSSEIRRQISLYLKAGENSHEGVISQETYRFDPETKTTILMRKKEFAKDYRYFPEPDIPPIVLTEEYIENIRKSLPELPLERERRYIRDLELLPDLAFFLVSDKRLADYFEQALSGCKNPKALCNWIIIEFAGRLKDTGKTLADTNIFPSQVSKLVNRIEEGIITGKIAKKIADDLLEDQEKDVDAIISENPDYQPLHDIGIVESYVDDVLKNNRQSVKDFLSGRDRAFAFLVGQVMKLSRGKASPELVNQLLKEKINTLSFEQE